MHSPLRPMVGLFALVISLSVHSMATAQAQPDPAPPPTATSADAEFWRSAERIGTVDALRAYLKAFPQGVYADLAKAAIDRLSADASAQQRAGGTPAAGTSLATGPSPGTGLKSDPAKVLAGVPTSGAITMMPGETYFGPGPITVGYLGAKKQLLLPNGAWVLVAVADRPSSSTTGVTLVSMVFAQFREGQLVSLMSYLFNGRTVRGRGVFP